MNNQVLERIASEQDKPVEVILAGIICMFLEAETSDSRDATLNIMSVADQWNVDAMTLLDIYRAWKKDN